MPATIIELESISELPKDTLYRMTYTKPEDGLAYSYQRPEIGRKWQTIYFVFIRKKEMENES